MANTVADILANRGIESDELSHYGVPGMKWGKRKARSGSKGKTSDAAKAKRELKGMTDDQLKAKIARLKLEREYTQLTTTPKGKSFVKTGAKEVGKLLLDVGKQEAKSYLQKEGKKALAEALAKNAAKKAATAGVKALTTGR